jgi:hypothetical protein
MAGPLRSRGGSVAQKRFSAKRTFRKAAASVSRPMSEAEDRRRQKQEQAHVSPRRSRILEQIEPVNPEPELRRWDRYS